MPLELIVMRLSDMRRVHPRQDNSRKCDICGTQVGIYPSGQAALRHNPAMQIICSHCHGEVDHYVLAPGAEMEPLESVAADKGKPK